LENSAHSSSFFMPDTAADPSTASQPTFSSRVLVFLSTGFGLATLTPVAPGTVGAILGVPLAIGLMHIPAIGFIPAAAIQAIIIVVLIIAGIPICNAGQRAFNVKDPSQVVWDELVTMPIVFWLLPPAMLLDLGVLVVGFALHRLLDILKPPPLAQLERLPGGIGIMADDVLAGIIACPILQALVAVGFVGGA
jgi:phosphatidylglycerophosphatase A